MPKVTVFYLILLNFLSTFFLGTSYFFAPIPNKDPSAYYFFDFLDLITGFLVFLDLKTDFLDFKKNLFRLFRPKNFFISTQNLKKHLLSL